MSDSDADLPLERPPGVLFVVANLHLDTQWRWTVRETIARYLPETLRRNLDLLERHPEYVATFEGAFRYMLAREHHPREFERLRAAVAAGRWRPAGAMLDAPDVNVPSPESLLRHVLYGNGFFERELGVSCQDLFLPDCFGFGWALPSIAAHCGLRGFSTSKLIKWRQGAGLPFDVAAWEGPDGGRVVAAIQPGGYGEPLRENLAVSPRWRRRLAALGERCGLYFGIAYFGVGDRGGAPDRRSLRRLAESVRHEGGLRVVSAGSDEAFRRLSAERAARLPVYRGELLLPTHGTGCYTSQARLKRENRRLENLADATERAAVAAAWLGASPYPAEALRSAWIRFLWHQMHDDLTGTSIPEAYDLTANDQAVARNRLAAELEHAIEAVGRGMDRAVEGLPLVVFNPLSVEREDLVEARLDWGGDAPPCEIRVFDPDGAEAPAQRLATGDGVLFLARVPAVGFAVYEARRAERPCPIETPVEVELGALANARYRARLDEAGDVASVLDLSLGGELLAAPLHLALLRDRSRRWPAWEVRYRDLCAPGERPGPPTSVRVLERGPARVALEVERAARGSTFRQTLRLGAGGAGERLEIAFALDWRTRGRLLKAVVPLALEAPEATYDLGLGAIRRGVNRPEAYEVPAQRWADLTSPRDARGVSVLNDGRYGWDRPEPSTLRLSLVRSPACGRRFRHQATQDFGRHEVLAALHGHAGSWEDGGTAWQAARLNQPLVAVQVPVGRGPLGRRWSFLETPSEAVAVTALKRAEEGDEIVVRLQEVEGREAGAVPLRFAGAVEAAREVDGQERPLGAYAEGPPAPSLRAFGIRALAVRLAPPEETVAGPDLIPLALPWDTPALSFHDGGGVDFDEEGHSIPGELFPPEVLHAGVPFRLADPATGGATAVACRGQRLEVPPGTTRLWLLATAVEASARGNFRSGSSTVELTVDFWTDRPRRVRRPWIARFVPSPPPSRPPERSPIAWHATHRHDRRVRDEPYVFCYVYRFALPMGGGPPRLELPEESAIRLFALTAEL